MNPPGAVTVEPLRTLAAAVVAALLIVFAPPRAIAPEKPPEAATAIATPTATASMVGVNIGVAAPMAYFPFGGSRDSFFGDLKVHGKDAFEFYTDKKVTISRWF